MPGPQLVGGPFADPDVEGLALPDDLGERLHRLFEWCLGVESVRLVQVDVIGPQPGQREVDRFGDVFAGQPDIVVPLGTGRPVDLGEDLQRFPTFALECVTEHRLGRAVGVDIRGVETGDAGVRAARTHWVATSFSTWEPWVSQLP